MCQCVCAPLRASVCVCVRACVRARGSHLHVRGPQGHTVGGEAQDDDDDVEGGLEVLVHLAVHFTERDVAHCPCCASDRCIQSVCVGRVCLRATVFFLSGV